MGCAACTRPIPRRAWSRSRRSASASPRCACATRPRSRPCAARWSDTASSPRSRCSSETDRLEILDGFKRVRAARALGWSTLLARIDDVGRDRREAAPARAARSARAHRARGSVARAFALSRRRPAAAGDRAAHEPAQELGLAPSDARRVPRSGRAGRRPARPSRGARGGRGQSVATWQPASPRARSSCVAG